MTGPIATSCIPDAHLNATYCSWGFQSTTQLWEYLTNDGNFVINVKSFREYSTNVVYDIEDDVKNISESIGFGLTETLNLNNIKRCHGDISGKDVSFNKNDEKIFVFRKTS